MLYCTILYCTICIITLDSEGFLHKQATSSHLLHTVTLDTAGSHHRSNYLRCYCLRVSFKINKPFSGSARARVHTHTHTHTRTAVPAILYHTAAGAVALLLHSPAGTVQRYWYTLHHIATHSVGPNYIRTPTFRTRHSVPHGPRPPEDEDVMFHCKVENTHTHTHHAHNHTARTHTHTQTHTTRTHAHTTHTQHTPRTHTHARMHTQCRISE